MLVSSTAVYGVPKVHPIYEDAPLVGVGWYGESKIEAEEVTRDFGRRGLEFAIVRPKTFIGPERLGVFEILFDWIRDDRRIYMLGDGENRYQLLAVEDLVDAIVLAAERPEAAGETVNVGAKRVRDGALRPAGADRPRRLDVAADARARPSPAEIALRALELLRVSPLAEWHYKTAHRDSFVDVGEGRAACSAGRRGSRTRRRSAGRTTGTSRTARRSKAAGVTHRVPWNQQALAPAEEDQLDDRGRAHRRSLGFRRPMLCGGWQASARFPQVCDDAVADGSSPNRPPVEHGAQQATPWQSLRGRQGVWTAWSSATS